MKIYKLPFLADGSPDGAYLLDTKELKTSAAYLRYTRLRPFESEKEIRPMDGCEEIIFVSKGSLQVKQTKSSFTVTEGEAFVSSGRLLVSNPNREEAVYVTAGGCLLPARRPAAQEEKTQAEQTNESPAKPAREEDPDEFEITRDDGPEGECE